MSDAFKWMETVRRSSKSPTGFFQEAFELSERVRSAIVASEITGPKSEHNA